MALFLMHQLRFLPETFMKKYPLCLPPEFERSLDEPHAYRKPSEAGVYVFDLRMQNDGGVCVNLQHRDLGDSGKFLFKAFWLPFDARGTTFIQLSDEAHFFFTAPLDGCRMQIGPGDNPRVLHISGSKSIKVGSTNSGGNGEGEDGTRWREQQAVRHMGEHYSGSRRFSMTQDYDHSRWAFFVGVRDPRLGWKFLAQGCAWDEETGKRRCVTRLSTHRPGTVVQI